MRDVREKQAIPLRDDTAQPSYHTEPISRASLETTALPLPPVDPWALLCEATLDLAADQHLPSLLQKIVERAVVLLGAGGGAIGIYDPVHEVVDLAGQSGAVVAIDVRQRLGEGMLGWIAATRTPLIGEAPSTTADPPTDNAESDRARSAMGVPLLYQGSLLGVLSIYADGESQRRYGAEDVSLLSRFAVAAAIAVHNARLLAQAHRRAEVEQVVANIATRFVHIGSGQVDDAVNDTLRLIGEYAEVDRTYLFQLTDDGQTMDNTHEWCGPGAEPRRGHRQGVATASIPWSMEQLTHGQATYTRRPDDLPAEAGAEKELLAAQGIHSFAVIPLVSGTRLTGLMGLETTHRERVWDAEDIALLTLIGEVFGLALDRVHSEVALHQREQELAWLVEETPDIVIRLDPHLRYQYVNPAGTRFAQKPLHEFLGRTPAEIGYGLDDTFLEHIMQARELFSFERAVFGEAGEVRHFQWRLVPEFDEHGQIKSLLTVGRDITDLKQVQIELEQLNHELEVRVAQRTSELATANVELQRVSRLQEAVLNSAIYMIVSTDAAGIVQTFNAGAERQLGYAAAEVIGRVSPVLFHDPAEVAERARVVQRTLGLTVSSSFDALVAPARSQGVEEVEYTMIRRNGSRFPALMSVSALRDATGETVGFLGIGSDITARKQAESVLRASEEQYRTLVDNSLQGVVIYQDGRIVFANAAMAAIAGYSVEELLAFEPAQVVRQVHPEDRPLIFPGTILPSAGVETRRVLQFRIMHRDGTARWVVSAAMQISYHGKPARQAVLVDITELKRAEESLLESQRFVDQITETSPNYIFVYDIDQHRDIYINPSAKLFLGYSTNELAALGDNFLAALVHPDDLPAALVKLARYPELRDGEYVEQEVRVKSAAGDWHWLLMRTSVFKRRPDGRAAQVLGVSMDITALKRSEWAMRNALAKERELSELKSRFVSMASHEFRTPLATILAATETLFAYRQRLDDQQTDLRLQRIRRQVQHLSHIIDDVLAMTHVQSGRIEFRPEMTDFDVFCHEIVEEFQSRSDIAHDLDYQCGRSPLVVAIDRKLMRTVVANLLSNAIKYSPKGSGVRIRVTLVDDLVRIAVTDTGIGIPLPDREHLFEAFYRASNVGAAAGTGLGLSIAKEFVELHGGQLAFASEEAAGTTFFVTIPAVR